MELEHQLEDIFNKAPPSLSHSILSQMILNIFLYIHDMCFHGHARSMGL